MGYMTLGRIIDPSLKVDLMWRNNLWKQDNEWMRTRSIILTSQFINITNKWKFKNIILNRGKKEYSNCISIGFTHSSNRIFIGYIQQLDDEYYIINIVFNLHNFSPKQIYYLCDGQDGVYELLDKIDKSYPSS